MGKPNVNVFVGGPVNSDPDRIYGTKYLKPNIPFGLQVTDEDTKYVVRSNFDLGGETVSVPSHCIVEFDGGSVNNGTLSLGPWCSVFGSTTGTRCESLFIGLHAQSRVCGLELYHPHAVPVGRGIVTLDWTRVYEDLWGDVWDQRDREYLNVINIKIDNVNFIGGRNDGIRNADGSFRHERRSLWYGGAAVALLNYAGGEHLGTHQGFYDFCMSNCKIDINLLAGVWCDTCYDSWMTALHFDKVVIGGTNYGFLLNRGVNDIEDWVDPYDGEIKALGQDTAHGLLITPDEPARLEYPKHGFIGWDNGECNNIKITDCEIQANRMMWAGVKADMVRDILINGTDFWDFYSSEYQVPYLVDMDNNCYGLTIDKVATQYKGAYGKLYRIRNHTLNGVKLARDANGNLPTGIDAKYNGKWDGDGQDGSFKYSLDGNRNAYPYTGGHINIGPNNLADPCYRFTDMLPESREENRDVTFGDIYNNVPSGTYWITPFGSPYSEFYSKVCANLGIDGSGQREYVVKVEKNVAFCCVHVYEANRGGAKTGRMYEACFYWSPSLATTKLKGVMTEYNPVRDVVKNIDTITYDEGKKILNVARGSGGGHFLGFRYGSLANIPFYNEHTNEAVYFCNDEGFFKTLHFAQVYTDQQTGALKNSWYDEQGFHAARSRGTTAQRPTEALGAFDNGFAYRDTTLGRTVYFKQSGDVKRWNEYDGAVAGVRRSGSVGNLPPSTDVYVGFMFMLTEGSPAVTKPVYYAGGSQWVYADGTPVTIPSQSGSGTVEPGGGGEGSDGDDTPSSGGDNEGNDNNDNNINGGEQL